MDRSATTMLHIGDWCVYPASSEISRDGETIRVEVRTMRLLLCLAERAGEVVSIDDLLDHVWSGVAVSQDSVYQAVASLRRLLGDESKQPKYIETVPRLGYRLLAPVSPWADPVASMPTAPEKVQDSNPFVPATTGSAPKSNSSFRSGFLWAAGAILCLALAAVLLSLVFHGKSASGNPTASTVPAPQPRKSIAVLPFLDLTQGMQQEEFADGMTEELIDRLSMIPGLQVPPPTSSFYFKGKQIPVAEIARSLGVAYVLDGSVRRSGTRVRVAARLIRVDSGYVIWSESYDRPFGDLLMVQDDIAAEVTKALNASIAAAPEPSSAKH
jgi:TolB-like protein/DNA-binding winged helix-turn-helix (wHTH) protein